MTKHITVGYDGSKPAAEAVAWAAAEAEQRGVPLHIVTCYELPIVADAMYGGWSSAEVLTALMDASEVWLREIGEVTRAQHPALEVQTFVSPGPASIALTDDVGTEDLLVVGASSHTGSASFWLGSTPRRVCRQSPCPTVVVHGPASRGRPDRVVVGVDGSQPSMEALEWAGEEADRHAVELVVVHGWSYPYLSDDLQLSQAHDIMKVDAECVLDGAVEHARDRFASAVTGLLVESSPVLALLESACDGDLMVLGSRGRGAFKETVFGSTVNSVVERSSVPVVVVHAAPATD